MVEPELAISRRKPMKINRYSKLLLNNHILIIAIRNVCYVLALFFIMLICNKWFDDSYTANLTFFGSFSIIFELLMNRCRKRHPTPRRIAYILTIIALTISILFLSIQIVNLDSEKNSRSNDVFPSTPHQNCIKGVQK